MTADGLARRREGQETEEDAGVNEVRSGQVRSGQGRSGQGKAIDGYDTAVVW